jgi:branched-chain amino acid transport system substrate-binding protein
MMGSFAGGKRKFVLPLAAVALAAAAVTSVASASSGKATASTIRIGVMSDCKGAFGSFDQQDRAGVIAAFSQFAGAKPKDPNDPTKGMVGGSIAGHPLKIVAIGCGSDNADLAIKETRRIMEQNKADIMIGPLSGDESVAIAGYAKAHQTKTFVDGSAGAQDTTLKVRAPNFFRFNGDGAQWNAGLGDLAYNKLGWKTAAVIEDNYSFGWTSAAGFIAEFCAVGGDVVQRVTPPLNTTDYSTYAQQLKTDVDGTFVAVGGSGLIPFLKAYEQAHGKIDSKKFIGNLFWGTPGEFESLSTDVSGAYVGGAGTAGDLDSAAAKNYANNIIGKWFKKIGGQPAAPQAASTFTYGFYVNTWGLIQGLKAVKGDISGGQKALQKALAKVKLNTPYGPVHLDKNRQAVLTVYYQQLYTDTSGKLAVKTVASIPNVDQTFGGTFSTTTPNPGPTDPKCVKASLPWVGKEQPVKVVAAS